MSETVFIKPMAGSTVQYPDSMTPIPASGVEVTINTYWLRRIADGSVVVVKKETAPAIVEEPKPEAAMESATNSRRGGR